MSGTAALWSALSRAELLVDAGRLSKEALDALCNECKEKNLSDGEAAIKIEELVDGVLALGDVA